MPITARSIFRGIKLNGGKIAVSGAAVDAAKTKGGGVLAGLPKTADGSLAVSLPVVTPVIPAPPGSCTKVLTSTDGVLSWETNSTT